ncbi:hypothetical protein VKT23_020003 [Stygiomarasmius scandens]|uniref:Uncharacterized protein n=1 Tax=Marasmiellus scandens TaxID=2682957 RepID=A0ABR1IN52_9AGAR
MSTEAPANGSTIEPREIEVVSEGESSKAVPVNPPIELQPTQIEKGEEILLEVSANHSLTIELNDKGKSKEVAVDPAIEIRLMEDDAMDAEDDEASFSCCHSTLSLRKSLQVLLPQFQAGQLRKKRGRSQESEGENNEQSRTSELIQGPETRDAPWVKNSVRVIQLDDTLKAQIDDLTQKVKVLESEVSHYHCLDSTFVKDIDLSTTSQREKDLIVLINKLRPLPLGEDFQPTTSSELTLWDMVQALEREKSAFKGQIRFLQDRLKKPLVAVNSEGVGMDSSRQESIDDLKEKEQISNLENQNKELSLKITLLTTKYQSEQADNANLKQQVASLEARLCELEQEEGRRRLEDLQNTLDAAEDKLQRDLQEAQRQRDSLQGDLNSIRNDYADTKHRLKELQSTVDSLQSEKSAADDKLQQDLQEAQQQRDSLQGDLNSIRSDYADATHRLKELQSTVDSLQSEESAADNEQQQQRELHLGVERHLKELQSDFDNVRVRNSELEQTLQELNDIREEDTVAANNDLQILLEDLRKAQAEKGSMEKERDSLNEQLRTQAESHKKAMTDLESTTSKDLAALKSCRCEIDKLKQEMNELKTAKESCKKDHSHLIQEKKEAEEKYRKYKVDLQTLLKEKANLEKTRDDLQASDSVKDTEIQELKSLLETNKDNLKDLEGKIKQYKETCSRLQTNMTSLRKDSQREKAAMDATHGTLRQEKKDTLKEKEGLKREVESYEKRVKDLEQDLQKERDNLEKSEAADALTQDQQANLRSIQNECRCLQSNLDRATRDDERKAQSYQLSLFEKDLEIDRLKIRLGNVQRHNEDLKAEKLALEEIVAESPHAKRGNSGSAAGEGGGNYQPPLDETRAEVEQSTRLNNDNVVEIQRLRMENARLQAASASSSKSNATSQPTKVDFLTSVCGSGVSLRSVDVNRELYNLRQEELRHQQSSRRSYALEEEIVSSQYLSFICMPNHLRDL